MRLHEIADYPGATPDQVFSIIRDDEFRAEVCEKMHAIAYEVSVDDQEDQVQVQIDRTMPAEMPDFIKRLTGDTVEVRQIETWGPAAADGSRAGTVRLTIKGQPASMDGTMAIHPTASGAELVVEGDLKVKIPLIGRKVEPEVAKAIVAALRVESEAGQARFAEG
ncbi:MULTISPECIES: DUF2505 domain-containing protein [Mumia]|uniref:DUF2505 domain-containing protein n=1 Tax=Mumia TaxID=1546255 RepID=UPI0014222CDE|nr:MULTISPECIES: DUF2505 domain-containing protein [unclassified Mumia]QMW65556.1 DUF2505 domain-containing protein [Mumia sp. ZJ1417]